MTEWNSHVDSFLTVINKVAKKIILGCAQCAHSRVRVVPNSLSQFIWRLCWCFSGNQASQNKVFSKQTCYLSMQCTWPIKKSFRRQVCLVHMFMLDAGPTCCTFCAGRETGELFQNRIIRARACHHAIFRRMKGIEALAEHWIDHDEVPYISAAALFLNKKNNSSPFRQ